MQSADCVIRQSRGAAPVGGALAGANFRI